MTVRARQTLAARMISSTVAVRRSRESRSASSAVSRPSLLRYRKQSTTVRAGVVMRAGTPSKTALSTP